MELLWKLSTFQIVSIQRNLLDRPRCKIRKNLVCSVCLVKFLLFCSYSVFYYQNKIIIYLFYKGIKTYH